MSRSKTNKVSEAESDAQLGIVPAGTPHWITAELIEATIRVWQPYYEAVISPEEAVTMIRSVGRLYQAFSSGINHEAVCGSRSR
jgi:hypothetical protein